jgi:dolichol-phosphate mannosyltransferase
VLASIDLDRVRSDGYAFQIELTWIAWKLGCSITEVPIIFWERRAGASKLNRRIIWEALWLVWRLRLGPAPRSVKA